MFRKSQVSLKGRWIISAIFFLTMLVPELVTLALLAPKAPYPRIIIGFSLIRLLWSVPLYYFTMLGHAWARAITSVLLIMGSAILCTNLKFNGLGWMLLALVFFISSAGVLIGAKAVRAAPEHTIRRHRPGFF